MSYPKVILLSSLIFSFFTSFSQAADGTFKFKGKVTNSGCVIQNPNIVNEGYTNLTRWTKEEGRLVSPGAISTFIDVDCGELASIPKVRFSAETGKIVGKQNTYLKVTGTASNVAFRIWNFNMPSGYFTFDDTLYDMRTVDASAGKYQIAVTHALFGLSAYDDSNNGDFEAVLGYELVYN